MNIEHHYVFVVGVYTPFYIASIRGAIVSKVVNNMKNRRSKLEIYLDVLKVIKDGTTKPTRIMYGANLSWKLLQGILNSMAAQDLIEEIDVSDSRDKRTNTVYQVTTKGDSVIRYFDRAKGLIEVDEPDFNPLQIARGR
jgi:predicted transcriptional regulator